ncbi:MAG: Asp-tRNA(Asn)/Glu-tRNA(Gln) amidotransferase subunit GatA [Firmicutes bacterium]|nr:Asp-tRNA(Asn)/Glu-tRNA(Gln) amidotransferase subunit GatA [Bacillota bacterium]
MNTFPYETDTALELGRFIKTRKISAPELTAAYLQRMNDLGPSLGAYITETPELALQQAEAVQKRLNAGEELSPLAGVPAAVKDNICTGNVRTTAGSRMLETFVPPYDAAVMERFSAAGGILLGKTNLDEFAMGNSTETSCFGVARNPWEPGRTAGGSSGGSAAAVAAGLAAWALGSDTGGSVRQPASFCNLSGIKPTYGAVSRYGLIAYASSLDQIGVLGRDILDAAAGLSVIAGKDLRDSTSVPEHSFEFESLCKSFTANSSPSAPFGGLRVGLPEHWLSGAAPDVKTSIESAAKLLESGGARIVPLSLPELDYAVPAYYIIACAEASSNLSRYDGIRYGHRAAAAKDLQETFTLSRTEGFGAEVKRRILLGTFVLSSGHFDAYYKKALRVRGLIRSALGRAFAQCDLILSPVSPTTAWKLGSAGISAASASAPADQDPLAMYRSDLYTVPANLAGIPAVSIPCGFSSETGLPIGMQLMGQAWSEPLLVQTAAAWQQMTDFHKQQPDLFKIPEGGVRK